MPRAPSDTVLSRLLRYVQIDTQSSEASREIPSTPGQWDLLRLLEGEVRALGASDVTLTEHGYVLATVPATSRRRGAPVVGFLAHVDTSPAFSGKNVKPLVHAKWDGRPIRLPDDHRQVLDPAAIPELRGKKGEDIVTASGRTLLGADDKAGVAVVMTLVAELLRRPDINHGPVRVCFNPDEETGRGVEKLDLDEFGADVAYTLDGEDLGSISWETFSADSAYVTIAGVSTHPGDAKKHRMVNAVHLAGKLLAALPREGLSPETTEGREGFIHPGSIEGSAAEVRIDFLLRDFELAGLEDKRRRLRGLCRGLEASEPRARVTCRIKPRYRNMAYWLRDDASGGPGAGGGARLSAGGHHAGDARRHRRLTPDRARPAHPQYLQRGPQPAWTARMGERPRHAEVGAGASQAGTTLGTREVGWPVRSKALAGF
jgi:tripeptide aminopeptidase